MRARLFSIAILAAACTVTLPFDELTDGAPRPIAQYSFEEGSGVSAQDAIGANQVLLADESGKVPQWTREGKRGGALEFPPDDGWVEAPALSDAKFPQRVTYSAWIRIAAFAGENDNDLLEVDDDTDTEQRTPIYLGAGSDGLFFVFHAGPTDAGDERVLVAPPIATGVWTFIAAGWDIPAKQSFLYVRPEGAPARPLVTGELPPGFEIRQGFLIFMAAGGKLDEVRIFDRPLVVNQLDALD